VLTSAPASGGSANAAPELLDTATEASMARQEPNPASAKEQAEGSRENVNFGRNKSTSSADEFEPPDGVDGKNDSGPEPDVVGEDNPSRD
jgi:hypothetical protein